MKKTFILCAVLFCGVLLNTHSAEAAIFTPEDEPYGMPITVHVDGKFIASDVEPVMQNNRVFLPMRAAAEDMGAYVFWDNNARCVSVQKNGITAYFYVDNPYYYVNDETRYSDVPPMIINGRTMLPIRAFAEALGSSVYWDGNILDVQILTGNAYQSGPASIPQIIPSPLHNAIEKYYVAPTKPGIGSWYSVYDLYGERYFEMLFISERSDGTRQCITFFSKDIFRDPNPEFLTIYKDPVSKLGSGCIVHHNGIESHIYESDASMGFTYSIPRTEYYNYGSQFNAADLQRTSIVPAIGNNPGDNSRLFTAF